MESVAVYGLSRPWNLSPSSSSVASFLLAPSVGNLSRPNLALSPFVRNLSPSVGNLARVHFPAKFPSRRRVHLSGISSQRKYLLLAESSPDGISSSSTSEIFQPRIRPKLRDSSRRDSEVCRRLNRCQSFQSQSASPEVLVPLPLQLLASTWLRSVMSKTVLRPRHRA